MIKPFSIALAAGSCLVAAQLTAAPTASAKELKVLSEKMTGFGHVESIGYDAQAKVFYTSDFGPAPKPADKDGMGKITKVSLDGKILADGFIKPAGNMMNKRKGI